MQKELTKLESGIRTRSYFNHQFWVADTAVVIKDESNKNFENTDLLPYILTGFGFATNKKLAEIKAKGELVERVSSILGNIPQIQGNWVPANQISTGKNSLLPPSEIFLLLNDENTKFKNDATGFAAHTINKYSIQNAILEVIERHSVTLLWRNWGAYSYQISLKYLSKEIRALFEFANLKSYLCVVPICRFVYLCVCILESEQGWVSCGAACNHNLLDAVYKSSMESIAEQLNFKNKNDSNMQYRPELGFFQGAYVKDRLLNNSIKLGSKDLHLSQSLPLSKRVLKEFESYLNDEIYIVSIPTVSIYDGNWYVHKAVCGSALSPAKWNYPDDHPPPFG